MTTDATDGTSARRVRPTRRSRTRPGRWPRPPSWASTTSDAELEAQARAAGPGRRRPAERRQVDAGQPDPRPPGGRRRGRPRRHPRPGRLRRHLERARASPSSTPAAGSPTPRAWPRGRRAGRARHRRRRRRACSSSTPPSASPTPTRPSSQVLRQSGKPVVLAANKVDDQRTEAEAAALWNLGLGEPFPVSRPARPGERRPARRRPRRAARGAARQRRARPWARAGSRCSASRTSASPACSTSSPARSASSSTRWPGTTVDPVDELIELGGETWRFVDTAGHPPPGARGVSGARVLRDRCARRRRWRRPRSRSSSRRERAAQPSRTSGIIVDGRRGRPRAGHRVQQVGPRRRGPPLLPRARDRARAGRGCRGRRGSTSRRGPAGTCDRLVPALRRRRSPAGRPRVPTGRLNAFLGDLVAATPPPVRGGKQPKILFATQAATRPPTFVLFTTRLPRGGATAGSSSAGCARSSASSGTPIEISVRVREKRGNESPGADAAPR